MSSESYEDYEKDYHLHLSRIRTYLADSQQRREAATLRQCEQWLQRAKQSAMAMQATAEIQNDARRITESKYLLQRDIGPLSKEIQRILSQLPPQPTGSSSGSSSSQYRNELFSSTTSTNNSNSNSNSYQAPTTSNFFNIESGDDTMLDSLIQSSDELLRESQSVLFETEGIGNQTIRQLVQQREQLIQTHGTLESLTTIMASSKRIITSMSRRACRNRLVLYMIIGVLMVLNVATLYWMYDRKYASHQNDHDKNPAPSHAPTST